MEKCIKTGSLFLIGICFLFLFSCEKKRIPKDKEQYSDTIKSGRLGLILYQTEDTIKINVKSLVESSTEDYKFVFIKNEVSYRLISQNMFGYFDLSKINLLNESNLDTTLYQKNELYDSYLHINQCKKNDKLYRLFLTEKIGAEQSLEIIYKDESLHKVQLVFFRNKYTFDFR